MMWNNASTAPTEEIRRAQYIRTAQAAGRQREGADVIKYAWGVTNVKAVPLSAGKPGSKPARGADG